MLYLLSPAKSLDYETHVPPEVAERATKPQFVPQAAELIELLRTRTPAQIAELMDLSDTLATLNVGRYAAWSRRFTDKNSKPAVLAFDGDVYEGLQAKTMPLPDLEWAQEHVVILSGLYGALRPLDRLQPYRLEMGTPLPTPRGQGLYAYWSDTITRHLNSRVAAEKVPVIVNLASQEYSKVADRKALRARVIDCVFEDWKGGQYKVISFFAKRARGLMCRWAVTHRVEQPQGLRGFNLKGYTFDDQASQPDRLVFRRKLEA